MINMLLVSNYDHTTIIRKQIWRQCSTCSNFMLRSPDKLHNRSQWCPRDNGLFSDGFHGWALERFQHFLSFCWYLVALNFLYFHLMINWPWKVNAIQKLLFGLKNALQKPHEASEGFQHWIYRVSLKTWYRHITWLCHPSQTKWKHDVKKDSCKNNAQSQYSITWHIDAIGLQKFTLGLPSHLLSMRLLQ
jgi:hypothetical protein